MQRLGASEQPNRPGYFSLQRYKKAPKIANLNLFLFFSLNLGLFMGQQDTIVKDTEVSRIKLCAELMKNIEIDVVIFFWLLS